MLLLIPLLPFVGFLVNAFFGRRLPKSVSGGVACLAIIGSFVVSVLSVLSVVNGDAGCAEADRRSTGCRRATLQVPFALPARSPVVADDPGHHRHRLADPHLLDRLHARGADSEYARYFSYLNLFASFMLVLVLGASFPVMFVGWEGRRPLLVPADRLLVHEAVGRRRRQEGVHRQPHRRLRLHPRDAADVRDLRRRSTSRSVAAAAATPRASRRRAGAR